MSKIEQQVMAGVAVIYVVRTLTSRTALELYTLALSFAGVAMFASLPHVATNFSHALGGGGAAVLTFALFALTHTSVVVQLATALGALALCALVADIIKSFSSNRMLAA